MADVATPQKPELNQEIGIGTTGLFGNFYQGKVEVLRKSSISVSQLRQMRETNGQARALHRLVTKPIHAAIQGASFVPAQNVAGGKAEAEFIQNVLMLPPEGGGMESPFSLVMRQMLNGVFDGFAEFERVYWVPKDGPLKGKLTLKKLAYRPSETVRILTDNNGVYQGFRQVANFAGRYIDERIDKEYSVHFVCQPEQDPLYGESFFLSAFYHYDKVVKLEYLMHLAAQRAATGTRVGKTPLNSTNKVADQKFVQSVNAMGAAQSIVFPANYDLDILKEATAFPFVDVINYHNAQMSKSILASFFDEHQGGSDTSFVDFGQQTDAYFLMLLDSVMTDIEAVINTQIIPPLIDANFTSKKYPKFKFGTLTSEQKEAIVELFSTLITAGQSNLASPQFTLAIEERVSQFLNLELDYDTIEKEQKAEWDLKKQMFEEQTKASIVGSQHAAANPGGTAPQSPTAPDGPPTPPRSSAKPGGGKSLPGPKTNEQNPKNPRQAVRIADNNKK